MAIGVQQPFRRQFAPEADQALRRWRLRRAESSRTVEAVAWHSETKERAITASTGNRQYSSKNPQRTQSQGGCRNSAVRGTMVPGVWSGAGASSGPLRFQMVNQCMSDTQQSTPRPTALPDKRRRPRRARFGGVCTSPLGPSLRWSLQSSPLIVVPGSPNNHDAFFVAAPLFYEHGWPFVFLDRYVPPPPARASPDEFFKFLKDSRDKEGLRWAMSGVEFWSETDLYTRGLPGWRGTGGRWGANPFSRLSGWRRISRWFSSLSLPSRPSTNARRRTGAGNTDCDPSWSLSYNRNGIGVVAAFNKTTSIARSQATAVLHKKKGARCSLALRRPHLAS